MKATQSNVSTRALDPRRGTRSTTRRKVPTASPEGSDRSTIGAASLPLNTTSLRDIGASGSAMGQPPKSGVPLRDLEPNTLPDRGAAHGGLRPADRTTPRTEFAVDTTSVTPVDLGDEVWLIDTRMGGYDGITAGYLIRGERPCLVETGAARSAGDVVAALASLGVGADDLATIVVTHIHLDHAGGVGDLAAAFPQAEVAVHEAGARHLADPSRLMRSAALVFGDVLDDLFGYLKPTDADRIRVLRPEDGVDLGGGRRLESFDSPGHARHHVGLLDTASGDLYTGDAAGVWTPETGDLRPATPPPDFDLEAALGSLERMRERSPKRLLFSHFGPVSDVETTLDRSVEELRLWVELVREAHVEGLDLDHAVARVKERTAQRYAVRSQPELEEKLEVLSSTEADVAGIWRWLDAQSLLESDSPST